MSRHKMYNWRWVWLVLLGLGGCGGQVGGRSPPPVMPASLVQAPDKPDRCRAALSNEAQLLAGALRQQEPQSMLAEGLESFSRAPIVTNEVLENIGILRQMLDYIGYQDQSKRLAKAAATTTAACQTIDSPEQRAQDAVDQAIELLAAESYTTMVEGFTPPQELKQMKASGHFDEVVTQLENGWGRVLLTKLLAARSGPPVVNEDGTISFHIPGLSGMLGQPVTLAERQGRWFFSEPEQGDDAPVEFSGKNEQLVAT